MAILPQSLVHGPHPSTKVYHETGLECSLGFSITNDRFIYFLLNIEKRE